MEKKSFKKAIVATLDTRKFVENLLYLGSLGGELTDKCVAMKGLMLRAEVELPADTIVETTPEMKIAAGSEYQKEETPKEEPVKEEKKSTRGRKPKAEETEEKTSEE